MEEEYQNEFCAYRNLINNLVDTYGRSGQLNVAPSIPYTSYYARYMEGDKLCYNNNYRIISFSKNNGYVTIDIKEEDRYDKYNIAFIDGFIVCEYTSSSEKNNDDILMSYIGYNCDFNNTYINNIVKAKELAYHQDIIEKFNDLTKPKTKVLTK